MWSFNSPLGHYPYVLLYGLCPLCFYAHQFSALLEFSVSCLCDVKISISGFMGLPHLFVGLGNLGHLPTSLSSLAKWGLQSCLLPFWWGLNVDSWWTPQEQYALVHIRCFEAGDAVPGGRMKESNCECLLCQQFSSHCQINVLRYILFIPSFI